MQTRIQYVDDEAAIVESAKENLSEYAIEIFTEPREALEAFRKNPYDILIVDFRMDRMDGLQLLFEAKKINADVVGILVTAWAEKTLLEEAINKELVYHVLEKPVRSGCLKAVLVKAIGEVERRRGLKLELEEAKHCKDAAKRLVEQYDKHHIVTNDPKMLQVIGEVKKCANTTSNVLITGESGVGKELFAHLIHVNSDRQGLPFIKVNCSAIAENLFESEMFGHEKGAYTGALTDKKGTFEMAHGGTLFLDEVGELPLHQQVKLLRVIEEREIKRVGGNSTIPIDIKLVCATNKDLLACCKAGTFREDLYHRITGTLHFVPALRERRDDIPLLAKLFLARECGEKGGPYREFTHDALTVIKGMPFPGNVRELQNIVKSLAITVERFEIVPADVMAEVAKRANVQDVGLPDLSCEELFGVTMPFNDFKKQVETGYLKRQLEVHENVVAYTAKSLNMEKSNLARKMKSLGIEIGN